MTVKKILGALLGHTHSKLWDALGPEIQVKISPEALKVLKEDKDLVKPLKWHAAGGKKINIEADSRLIDVETRIHWSGLNGRSTRFSDGRIKVTHECPERGLVQSTIYP